MPKLSASDQIARRMRVLSLAGILAVLAVAGQLVRIQIFTSYRYQAVWRTQSESRLLLPAKRGTLCDRNGEKLAYSLDLPVALESLPHPESPQKVEISASLSRQGRVKYRKRKRVYPFGRLAGQVLGFVGQDGYGLAGIEYGLDDLLRGNAGWAIVGCDGKQRTYPIQGTPKVAPRDGCHVMLTLDARIQAIVENALRRGVEETGARRGMGLVMDPCTGEILAMASFPFFDPNRLSQYQSRDWKNLCISFTYEPGSTFKIVTAGAALESEAVNPLDSIDGNLGTFTIYDEVIHDRKPYGKLPFRKALAYSSNVCFAKVANSTGRQELYRYSRAFGFGGNTGVQLPGEEGGALHPVNQWSGRTLVTMAIGHEVSGTLLQSACAFATVANKGVFLRPQIIREVRDARGRVVRGYAPQVVRRVVSEKTAEVICRYLEDVVTYGTGKAAGISGVGIAGKTGTAEKADPEKKAYLKDKVVASFIGFAPVHQSKLLCAISLDEPRLRRSGGLSAAPVFKEIILSALRSPRLPYATQIVMTGPGLGKDSPYASVPRFLGMAKPDALRLVGIEGFRSQWIGRGDRVAVQWPQSGSLVPSASTVTLYANRIEAGNKGIRMPRMIGKSIREALEVLNLLGLRVQLAGTGSVVGQSISPGSMCREKELCILTGSNPLTGAM